MSINSEYLQKDFIFIEGLHFLCTEISMPNNEIDFISTEMVLKPSPIRQMKAMIKKRLWHFARDWKAPLAALFLPTMFVAVAMGFSLIRPPSEDEPALILTPKLYNTHPTYFYR